MTYTSEAATPVQLVFVSPLEDVKSGFELHNDYKFQKKPNHNYIDVPTPDHVRLQIFNTLSWLSVVGQPVLAQFWAPKKAGNTFLLTTPHQPCGFYGTDKGLAAYHKGCLHHKLFVHRDGDVSFGLPGLAFKEGTPQQTENVHHVYNTEDKCPLLVKEEIFSSNWGSFAVPVFFANECVGVIEFLMTEQKSSYDAEIHEVCAALKFAGFQSSSNVGTPRNTCITNKLKPSKTIIPRKTQSSKYAHYNYLVPYFGLSMKEAMKRIARDLKLQKKVTPSTLRNTLRKKVHITEWPHIKNTAPKASESSRCIGIPDTALPCWDEEGTSGCLREQTLNPITYTSETQVYQPVEASIVAAELANFDLDECINWLLWEPTPPPINQYMRLIWLLMIFPTSVGTKGFLSCHQVQLPIRLPQKFITIN